MPFTPPRFIYFDMGNVLLHFDRRIAVDQITQISGAPRDHVQAFIDDEPLRLRWESGALSVGDYHEQFCQRTATRPPLDEWNQAISAIFEINAPIIPLLVHLRASQHRLGILSNTCDGHWNHVIHRFRMIRELFDIHIVSFRVGATKPSPEIFLAAADGAHVPPEQIFFTDDHPANVRAAHELGWQASLFTTPRAVADELHQRGLEFNY